MWCILFHQSDPSSVPQLAWQFVPVQKMVNPILAFCKGDTVHFLLVSAQFPLNFIIAKYTIDFANTDLITVRMRWQVIYVTCNIIWLPVPVRFPASPYGCSFGNIISFCALQLHRIEWCNTQKYAVTICFCNVSCVTLDKPCLIITQYCWPILLNYCQPYIHLRILTNCNLCACWRVSDMDSNVFRQLTIGECFPNT